MEITELKKNVAQNIFFLRTANGMTQSELGERLNYSDKAISKWERAEGLPDAFVLKRLSELFNVSVDYLLSEHTEQDRHVDTAPIRNTKRLISHTVALGIIAVSVLLTVILYLTLNEIYWQIFIYALPVIFTSQLVFSAVWHHIRALCLCVSLLMWSLILTVYIALLWQNNWQLFLIGIPAQLIILLSFKTSFYVSLVKKTSGLFKRKGERLKGDGEIAKK